MKIILSKKEILKSATHVSYAVASKAMISVLECFLLSANEDHIILKGTNNTLSIKTKTAAQVLEQGSCVLNAKLFLDIINKYPDDDITLETKPNNVLSIKCKNAKSQLKYIDSSEYPVLPEEVIDNPLEIEQGILKSMINKTIFSCAVSEDKPVLTGVLFEIEDNILTLVALDGFRLALQYINLNKAVNNFETVIPGKSLRETSRILEDNSENIKIAYSNSFVLIEIDDTQIYTRVLNGDYVKYKNILPKEYLTRIKVNREAMLNAIERASVLSREDTINLIKLNISADTLIIDSNSNLGNAHEEIEVYMEGKDLIIAFNAKYLLDILKCIEEEEIIMDFNTGISPCTISNTDGNYKYLILPVQLRG